MYTEAELVRCATWCLQTFSGTQHVYVRLRDVAILLFSTTTAVRRGSSQILHWSDMFVSHIPMDDMHLRKRVLVSHEMGSRCPPLLTLTDRISPTGPCCSRGQRET